VPDWKPVPESMSYPSGAATGSTGRPVTAVTGWTPDALRGRNRGSLSQVLQAVLWPREGTPARLPGLGCPGEASSATAWHLLGGLRLASLGVGWRHSNGGPGWRLTYPPGTPSIDAPAGIVAAAPEGDCVPVAEDDGGLVTEAAAGAPVGAAWAVPGDTTVIPIACSVVRCALSNETTALR
jgi:hypothetical protein